MLSSLRSNLCKRAPALKRFPQCQFLSTTEATAARPESQVASSLLQIGTRRIFEHEHDQYRELVRRFYEKKVIPFHPKWEEVGHVPRELWKEAGEEGRHRDGGGAAARISFSSAITRLIEARMSSIALPSPP